MFKKVCVLPAFTMDVNELLSSDFHDEIDVLEEVSEVHLVQSIIGNLLSS